MKGIARSRVAAVAVGSLVVMGLGAGGAVAANTIGSQDIRNQSIRGIDVAAGTIDASELRNRGINGPDIGMDTIGRPQLRPGSVGANQISPHVMDRINKSAEDGKPGEDGVANVNAGANYEHTWPGDNGESLNTIIQKCPDGQVATGGGYSTWGGSDVNEGGTPYDLGGDNKNIQVTVSAPYTEEAYDPDKYGGNIRPTEWIVKGYNNGSTDQVVRAWVVCADVPS
jgi:hypothetical protein